MAKTMTKTHVCTTHSLMEFVTTTGRNIYVWIDVQSVLTGSSPGKNINELFVI